MNIYIDAGFYVGKALQHYLDTEVVDDTWTIYVFEPSPDLPIKDILANYSVPIKLSKTAAWIKDGTMPFWTSERNNASFIDGTSYTGAPKKKIRVKTIDFSKFVADLPEAYIILSMDIEGSEYPVLEKMLKDNTIDKINLLDIEFHHRFMGDKTDLDSRQLIHEIKQRGVDIRLKEALN